MKAELTIEDLQLSNSLIALNTGELRQIIGGVIPFSPYNRLFSIIFNPDTPDGIVNKALYDAAMKLGQEGNVDRGREIFNIFRQRVGAMHNGQTLVNQIVFPF